MALPRSGSTALLAPASADIEQRFAPLLPPPPPVDPVRAALAHLGSLWLLVGDLLHHPAEFGPWLLPQPEPEPEPWWPSTWLAAPLPARPPSPYGPLAVLAY